MSSVAIVGGGVTVKVYVKVPASPAASAVVPAAV